MGRNGKFGAAALALLMVSLAGPALAGAMPGGGMKGGSIKGEKNFSEARIVHVDSGLGRTNMGGTAACPSQVVCMVNGVIINGPGAGACNGGSAVVVSQCHSKGR